MKAVRFLISVLLISGAFLALCGIFLFVYNGDASSGQTYLKIAGGEINAHFAGGLRLAAAVALFGFGVFAVRHRRIRGGRAGNLHRTV